MNIERSSYLSKINKALKSVPVILLSGARQVGKTTLMENVQVPGKQLMLNGQDPEIMELFQKLSVIEKFLEINLDEKLKGLLLIDEFQFIPGISTILKLLADKHKSLKIICSGSSSLDIARKMEESMAGRVRTIPVYSLSFEEYIRFQSEALYSLYSKYSLSTVHSIVDKRIVLLMRDYLLYGGLPKIALTKSREEKISLLNDLYQTYLLRDVRSYVKDEDFVAFNKLLKLLSAQIGNFININELSNTVRLSYSRCEEYIHLLEQMFIIRLISPFVTNKRKEITKMKKVYFYDIGMRNMIYNSFNDIEIRTDNGAIFENFVYLELLKNMKGYGNINYYRTKDGAEVDFVIDNLKNKIAVEVKYNTGKNYDARNLQSFSTIEKITKSYLVNIDRNEKREKINYIQGYIVSKITEI